jgi:hypothetical protein
MGRPLGLETLKEGVIFIGLCVGPFILRLFFHKA